MAYTTAIGTMYTFMWFTAFGSLLVSYFWDLKRLLNLTEFEAGPGTGNMMRSADVVGVRKIRESVVITSSESEITTVDDQSLSESDQAPLTYLTVCRTSTKPSFIYRCWQHDYDERENRFLPVS